MLAFATKRSGDSGIRIRPMSDVDLGSILELRSVVRWSGDPRAFDLLRGVKDARWAVAETPDGSLAGMVGAVPLGEVGVLCHLAVREDYRRAGLGTGLARWALAYLRSAGVRTVRLYSTRQAEALYLALGFKPIAPRTVYRLEGLSRNPQTRERESRYQVAQLLLGDLPELYGLDRWSYGGDRSALVFATIRLHPGGGLVARDENGLIKGYLIRSSSDCAERIGPFLAATPQAARVLLARALRSCGNTPVEVTVPGYGPAHELLGEFGFEGRRGRLRMELGAAEKLSPGLDQYGTTPYLAT